MDVDMFIPLTLRICLQPGLAIHYNIKNKKKLKKKKMISDEQLHKKKKKNLSQGNNKILDVDLFK